MAFTAEHAQQELQFFTRSVLSDARKFQEEHLLPAMDESSLLEKLHQTREQGREMTKLNIDAMSEEQKYFYAMALVQEQLEDKIRLLGGELPQQIYPAENTGEPPFDGTPALTGRISSTVQRSLVDNRVAARLQEYIAQRNSQQKTHQQPQLEQYAQNIHAAPKWFQRKNSPEMEQLLGTLSQLTQRQRLTLPDNEEEALSEATAQEQLYQTLVGQCDRYLEGHPAPKTTAGKTRRQQVENIRSQCMHDMAGLTFHAAELVRMGVKATWSDVQSASREIRLEKAEIEKSEILRQQEENFTTTLAEKIADITDPRERHRLMRHILLERTEKLEKDAPWFGQLLKEYNFLTPRQIREAVRAYYQAHSSDFLWKKGEKSHVFMDIRGTDENPIQETDDHGTTVQTLGEKQSTVTKISYLEENGDVTNLFFKGHESKLNLLDSEAVKQLGLTADETKKVSEMIDKVLEMPSFTDEIFETLVKTDLHCEEGKRDSIVKALYQPLSHLRGKRVAAKNNAELGQLRNDSEEGINMRNVMTSIMAKMLHVPDLIAKSHAAKLTLGEKELRGIMMEEAKGTSMADIDRDAPCDEDLFRQLQNLQLLDFICAQLDRHMENYFVRADASGKLVQIIGIDNDLSFGALTTEQYAGLEYLTHVCPCVEANGTLRDFGKMDPAFVQSIMNLNEAEIDFFLGSYLADEERTALLERVTSLQKALLNYIGRDGDGNLDLTSSRFKEGTYRSTYAERAGF